MSPEQNKELLELLKEQHINLTFVETKKQDTVFIQSSKNRSHLNEQYLQTQAAWEKGLCNILSESQHDKYQHNLIKWRLRNKTSLLFNIDIDENALQKVHSLMIEYYNDLAQCSISILPEDDQREKKTSLKKELKLALNLFVSKDQLSRIEVVYNI